MVVVKRPQCIHKQRTDEEHAKERGHEQRDVRPGEIGDDWMVRVEKRDQEHRERVPQKEEQGQPECDSRVHPSLQANISGTRRTGSSLHFYLTIASGGCMQAQRRGYAKLVPSPLQSSSLLV